MSFVPRFSAPLIFGSILLVTLSGCGDARFVAQDQFGGVVAIPSNSNSWPTHFREKAEKLMTQKCPQGYNIDREEEAVVGQTTTASTNTDTRTYDLQNGRRAPAGSLATSTTNRSVAVQNQTEYRITFHAKNAVPAPVRFTAGPRVASPSS